MSDGTRNFTLRLSSDDQARLERLATRLSLDRTGALRFLIRRASAGVNVAASGRFISIGRGRAQSALPIRLTFGGGDGS